MVKNLNSALIFFHLWCWPPNQQQPDRVLKAELYFVYRAEADWLTNLSTRQSSCLAEQTVTEFSKEDHFATTNPILFAILNRNQWSGNAEHQRNVIIIGQWPKRHGQFISLSPIHWIKQLKTPNLTDHEAERVEKRIQGEVMPKNKI